MATSKASDLSTQRQRLLVLSWHGLRDTYVGYESAQLVTPMYPHDSFYTIFR